MEATHLLVIGAPRSGTTLLAAMLGSHPDVAILNEEFQGAMASVFSKRVRGVKLCTPNQIELDRKTHPVLALAQSRSVAVRRVAGRLGIPRSRWSIRDYLRLPNPHIVAIIRDKPSVVASMTRRNQYGFVTPKLAEARWSRTLQMLRRLQGEKSPLAVVAYPELVRTPAVVMRRLTGWLGLEWSPAVLTGYEHTPQYPGRRAIDAAKARDVLSGLSQAEQAAVQAVLDTPAPAGPPRSAPP